MCIFLQSAVHGCVLDLWHRSSKPPRREHRYRFGHPSGVPVLGFPRFPPDELAHILPAQDRVAVLGKAKRQVRGQEKGDVS